MLKLSISVKVLNAHACQQFTKEAREIDFHPSPCRHQSVQSSFHRMALVLPAFAWLSSCGLTARFRFPHAAYRLGYTIINYRTVLFLDHYKLILLPIMYKEFVSMEGLVKHLWW